MSMSPILPQLYATSTLICILLALLFILSHLNLKLDAFNSPIPLLNQFKNRKSLFSQSQSTSLRLPQEISQSQSILPIPSQTYVISLPRRRDRFDDMEVLRARLGLNRSQWTYFAAEDSNSSRVEEILAGVRLIRQDALKANLKEVDKVQVEDNSTGTAAVTLPFKWPDANRNTNSTQLSQEFKPSSDETSSINFESESELLTCATQNFTLIPYSPHLPAYKILSPSRIACWHSHLSVIRRLVSESTQQTPDEAALILEDDVDMEVDIHARLAAVWGLLPVDWDIVFLGHCWSNESYFPALEPPASASSRSSPTPSPTPLNTLHPSHAPLCTHAYALSPSGAQRLLHDLTYPPFAYSRAIDHALAWLVQSKRLNAFSVVPSVVVQRKVGGSDVMKGKGSKWRERLTEGVLEADGS
ncbi:hypothetical protein R3P38DRAFT_2603710 [Favolaschia claudopus]|uniref:Glycosyl transferase family 25 domain-containing protein n=1 Tax=Favolaschia claudopus TaxID=2862362 RepID=A0AAW0DKT0_9AGAR